VSTSRVLLTLATLAFAVGCYLLMRKGWRERQRRQADLPAPPAHVPGDVVAGPVPGLFVGTVVELDWLDRVAVHGLSDRSAGELVVTTAGVEVRREGTADLFLPYAALVSAVPGDALAGKVMGRDGLLLLTWRLGERTLVSAFRATDHAEHLRLAQLVTGRLVVTA
jgi:hypothetical protein